MAINIQTLTDGCAAAVTLPYIRTGAQKFTVSASGQTSSGSGSATIYIEATNTPAPQDGDFQTLGIITLTLGTSKVSDGFGVNVPWDKVRARVSAISGTGASVSIYVREG